MVDEQGENPLSDAADPVFVQDGEHPPAPSPICPVCHSSNLRSLRAAMGERSYCLDCFHGWRPTRSAFAYEATAMCSLGTSTKRLAAQVAFFSPFVPASARILEVGCATGELARATREALQPLSYEAIELSAAGEKARSVVSVLHASPLRHLIDDGQVLGPFDVVLMSHVLEHLEDPAAELAAIVSVLTSSGALFVEVPNASGNRALPIDDNRSHLHFFSANSLARLLAAKGLEVVATRTDQRLDDRYADSLQVVARPFEPPHWSPTLLSDHPALKSAGKLVVWGAGSLADEILANFFDPERIDFFVDNDSAKQGTLRLGRPVFASNALAGAPRTILVNSIDFAPAIERDIREAFPRIPHRLIRIGDLLGERP